MKIAAKFARSRALVWALLFVAPWVAQGRGGSDGESELKSACVYNFTKYTSFQIPDGKIVVGIVGDEGLVPTLERVLAGKSVDGHPFSIRKVSDEDDMRACSVVFICSSEASRVGKIASELKGSPVLTIGDSPNFTSKGVMINMLVEDNHVHFSVNIAFAKASHVGINSKLLQLAQQVEGS